MKKRVRQFLFILAFLALAVGTSYADVAYTTSDYTTGTLGSVMLNEGQFVLKPSRIANLTADPVAFGLDVNGQPRLLVVERNTTTNDAVSLYDPTNLSTTLFNTSAISVRNTYKALAIGSAIYMVGRDSANVVKVDAATGAQLAEWKFGDSLVVPGGYNARGVDLIAVGSHLYALFVLDDNQYPAISYMQSRLVQLDTDLKYVTNCEFAKNANTVRYYSGSFYVSSWGGNQDSTAIASDSLIQTLPGGAFSTANVSTVATGADFGGQIAGLCIAPSGVTLLAAHVYAADFTTDAKVYRLPSLANVANKTEIYTGTGWMTHLVYDVADAVFWVANGSGSDAALQLRGFAESGSAVAGYNSAALGGPIYTITTVASSGITPPDPGPSGGGSGGGCDAGGLGMAFAGAALALSLARPRSSKK